MSKDPIVYMARVSPTRDMCLSCDKGIDAGDMYISKSRRHFGVTEYCISCACENIQVGERDGLLDTGTPIYIEEHLVDDKRYSGVLSPLIDYRRPLKIKGETMKDEPELRYEHEEVSPDEETDRTTAVDDFMAEAVGEPPAPHIPTIMSKLKGSVDMPEEFKFADSMVFYTMLRNIFRGKSILVTGPSGCGKSSLGKILADITNKPYYAFNFGDTMNPAAKILGDTKYDSERGTFFKKSRFVSALQDRAGSFIMLDEVTRDRTGDLANILMPVLDGQKYLALDESDDADTVDINANAFFYATANIGREYLGAAHDLDRAWKDRFTGGIYELEYLPKQKEKELLMIRSPSLDEKDAERITDFASRVRDLYSAEEISTAVSTRMCLSTAEFVVDGMSLIDALKQVCLPFYPIVAGDDSERVQVIQTIQSMGD
jgi:MoxR-like ATPase